MRINGLRFRVNSGEQVGLLLYGQIFCLHFTALNTGFAVVSSVVAAEIDSPLLTRMRNEAASDLAGISAGQANGGGSSQLLLLLLLAPPQDSDVTFIPSQRALMVIQTIEKWISSDEDIEPIIESRTLALLSHLAPILQSVVGRHWDFAFDLIENTLEVYISLARLAPTESFVA